MADAGHWHDGEHGRELADEKVRLYQSWGSGRGGGSRGGSRCWIKGPTMSVASSMVGSVRVDMCWRRGPPSDRATDRPDRWRTGGGLVEIGT